MLMQDRWYQDEAVEALFDYYSQPRQLDDNGKPKPKNAVVCLPTGTGKSIVIAKFLRRAFEVVPQTRAVMATHVKELIEQNAKKLQQAWPLAPLGVFSAGLKSRDTIQPIIFGGIQSMAGKFPLFGYRDFLIIDEGHLVGDDGSYLTFITELLAKNPFLKVIMLTATPFRLGMGLITNGKIATDIVYNLCDIEGFNRLIAEGFLCPLIPKRTNIELDISGVGISKGEYVQSELERAVNKKDVTYAALTELVQNSQGRHSWLLFASGVQHAEDITDMLTGIFGVSAVAIHSKKKDADNTNALADWKAGRIIAAVSMNSLTTGVDNPACDLIGMFRPTCSPGLWVQMLGRGTRPYDWRIIGQYIPGFEFVKENCLVLDFAGNTRRLGPINDPLIPRIKGQGPPGDAPVRICPNCNCYNHASARFCVACGVAFTFDPKINRSASTEEVLRSDLPQIEMFKVDRAIYVPHTSAASRDMIKVAYYCGLRTFYEYVTVQGERKPDGTIAYSFASKKGRDWFRQRFPSEPPETNAEVLQVMSQLRAPAEIRVWVNCQYPRILGYEF